VVARDQGLLAGYQRQASEDRRQDEQDEHGERQHRAALTSEREEAAKDMFHRVATYVLRTTEPSPAGSACPAGVGYVTVTEI
jgi:hypothetical protein